MVRLESAAGLGRVGDEEATEEDVDKTAEGEEVEDGWEAAKEECKDVTEDPGDEEVEDLEKCGERDDLEAE